MLSDHIPSSSGSLSEKPRLLRTPTPVTLTEDISTLVSETSSHSFSSSSFPTTASVEDAANSRCTASHGSGKRKSFAEDNVHFHDYPSHAAFTITATITTPNDHPVNTTSGEHATTSSTSGTLPSNSGHTLRKILESRRRIQELLARHAREEDSAIARLTKENTVYNKTLHHIPAPMFARSSRSARRSAFRKKGSTSSSSLHNHKESRHDKAPSCLRHPVSPPKVKIVRPSPPCAEVPKSPDYQADDELDELENEDISMTGLAPLSPPIKSKLSILELMRPNKRARHDSEFEQATTVSSLPQDAPSGEPMRLPVRHQMPSRPIDSASRQTKAVRFDDSLNQVVAYSAEDPAREVSCSSDSTGDASPPGAALLAWFSPSDASSLTSSFSSSSPSLSSSSSSSSSSTAPPTPPHPSSPDPVSSSTKRKPIPCDSSDTPRPLKRRNRDSLSPPQPDHRLATVAPLPMLRRQSSSVSLLDTMSS
ncbi:unnamed protein product [Mortierella alpina]